MSEYTETKVGKYIVRNYSDVIEYWYLNDLFHREYGPAVKEVNGSEKWYKNGEYHREDGPAVKYKNGAKYWCLNDKYLLKKEYKLVPISYRINIIYE